MPDMEALLVAAGLSAGTIPVVSGFLRARPVQAATVALVVFLGVSAGFSMTTSVRPGHRPLEMQIENRPIQVPDAGYATSTTCRACHPSEFGSWHDSYHRTMTQVATPASVVAPFDGIELHLGPRRYSLHQFGDSFWVDMDDPEGLASEDVVPRVRRRIVVTTGSHAMQAYWFETGAGRRLGLLPFAYRIDEGRWITDHSSFLRPPWPEGRAMPVAAPGEWNNGCISCHATRGEPRLREDHGADTHVTEFGIACEACHGPAEEHVRANRDPKRRYELHLSEEVDTTVVQPGQLPARRASQVCGQCHSIFVGRDEAVDAAWREDGYHYRPGDELTDTRVIARGRWELNAGVEDVLRSNPTTRHLEESFWSDGMVRVSGREYNGLIETPCYQRGEMSCLSCHAMHRRPDDRRSAKEWANDQLKPGMDGDAACLQCHESLVGRIEPHTHHKAESSGSRCYNCHMPYTTYGLHKAIRSHQVDSPTVGASLETGRPNACNQCHLDRTMAWSAEHLQRWYGIPAPVLTEEERAVAASLLWTLRGDAGQRALMAWTFGWEEARVASGSAWMAPFVGHLLLDPYEAVRYLAGRSIRELPGFEGFEYDFLAGPEERIRAAQAVPRLWRSPYPGMPDSPGEFEPVLLSADGRPRFDLIGRLAAQRDDRPVLLRE